MQYITVHGVNAALLTLALDETNTVSTDSMEITVSTSSLCKQKYQSHGLFGAPPLDDSRVVNRRKFSGEGPRDSTERVSVTAGNNRSEETCQICMSWFNNSWHIQVEAKLSRHGWKGSFEWLNLWALRIISTSYSSQDSDQIRIVMWIYDKRTSIHTDSGYCEQKWGL